MLSVIVCTYNRAKYIGTCIEKLANQNCNKKDYEVLIVDNKSTDNSKEIIDAVISKYPEAPLKYYLEENQGHTYARNRGIKEAKGNIISFLDDDAFVKNDYVENLTEYFSKHPDVQAVGGKIVPVYETQEPKWMSKYLLTLVSALDMGDNVKEFPSSKFPIGANMAFRATVFDKYGLFNVELGRRADGLEGGDEKEVFIRLRRNNEPIHYVPSIEVEHIIPEKRTRKEYIKGLGIGVGSSEMKRLKSATPPEKLKKYFSEVIKWSGSIYLFFLYNIKGKYQAATMLIKFRYWVLKGMMQ